MAAGTAKNLEKFTEIARPGIPRQESLGLRANSPGVRRFSIIQAFEHGLNETVQVGEALAERGNLNDNRAQVGVKIGKEPARAHFLGRIRTNTGDHSESRLFRFLQPIADYLL